MRGSRASYGILIMTDTQRSAPAILCVQQHISYTFRTIIYRLSLLNRKISSPSHHSVPQQSLIESAPNSPSPTRIASSGKGRKSDPLIAPSFLSSAGVEESSSSRVSREDFSELRKLISSLSPREFGILTNANQFETEVRRAYLGGREKYIARVLHAYEAMKSSILKLKPDLKAKERRWSPPKGGARTDGVEESELDVIMRETWEETGLRPDQYSIIDPDSPIKCEYEIYNSHLSITLYRGKLTSDIPFPMFNEGDFPPSVPRPMMPEEISRTGLIPLTLLDEYLPVQYGSKVKAELTRIVSEKKRDEAVLTTATSSSSATTLICSLRRDDSPPILREIASPTLRHHQPPPIQWTDIPSPHSSGDEAPSASSQATT